MQRIKIPAEMLKVIENAWMIHTDYPADPSRFKQYVIPVIEAALSWLDAEVEKLIKSSDTPDRFYRSPSLADTYQDNGFNLAIRAVRDMFLAPDLEEPEAIKDLMNDNGPNSPRWKAAILEAYNRGRKKHGEPEESVYRRATMAIGAVTLSRLDGERIIEYVRGLIHG